jgi:hypothetical protein
MVMLWTQWNMVSTQMLWQLVCHWVVLAFVWTVVVVTVVVVWAVAVVMVVVLV